MREGRKRKETKQRITNTRNRTLTNMIDINPIISITLNMNGLLY